MKIRKNNCLFCAAEFTGDYRKRFCNHKCAASYNTKTISFVGRNVEEWLNSPDFKYKSTNHKLVSVAYMPETIDTEATWVAVLEEETL